MSDKEAWDRRGTIDDGFFDEVQRRSKKFLEEMRLELDEQLFSGSQLSGSDR